MIDKPFMGEPTETRCVDDILERVMKVSMPGLYKRLDLIGQKFCCTSMRETLTLLCEYMTDYLKKEEDQAELPGYGEHHDYGRAMDDVRKYKRKQHRTPDSTNRPLTIRFDSNDREVADMEAESWDGEHRQTEAPPTEMPDWKPFGVEP